MVSRRALLASAFGGAVAPAVLGACRSAGQPSSGAAPTVSIAPVTITWLAPAGAGPETEQYQLNVDDFAKRQSTITVDWINSGDLDTTLAKFLTMTAGGTAPDVVQTQYAFCVDLASRGTLASLDPFMARDHVRKEDYLPGLPDEFAWKKVQYGLPKDNALRVLFYNLDLFDQAGVSYPTPTWTWDDFLEAARRLVNRAPASGTPTFGIHSFFLTLNDSPSYSLTRAFGGEWYDSTWTSSVIDSAATIEAIQFTADWQNRYKVSPGPGELPGSGDPFRKGYVAMGINFAQQVFFLKDEKVSFRYDVVPLPRGRSGAFPCVTGSGYSLAKAAPHPEAGWQYLKYLTGPDAQRRITSLKRWGSSRMDTLEAILPDDGVPKGFKSAFIEPLQGKTKDRPVAIPTPPRAKDLEAIYRQEFAAVQNGQKTAKEVAASVRPQLDEVMKAAGGR